MGYGDQLIATGLARGALKRGKRIAFGNGLKILWDSRSDLIFRNNPNIARPGEENSPNLEWIEYYKGKRNYNRDGHGRWIWNMGWKCIPGELFFTREEERQGKRFGENFILIEPNIESWKGPAQNKDWGRSNYEQVCNRLVEEGNKVFQFVYKEGGPVIRNAHAIRTTSFRDALAVLQNAKLYIGPEGGLHHGSAAVGIPAVVIFGGFIPPQVTGYDSHVNLIGSDRFCGSFTRCRHCADAMSTITVDKVHSEAVRLISG